MVRKEFVLEVGRGDSRKGRSHDEVLVDFPPPPSPGPYDDDDNNGHYQEGQEEDQDQDQGDNCAMDAEDAEIVKSLLLHGDPARENMRLNAPPPPPPPLPATVLNTKRTSFAREDKLDLAGLLNCLDGVIDCPGRIVIMTSNHPEKLDSAL